MTIVVAERGGDLALVQKMSGSGSKDGVGTGAGKGAGRRLDKFERLGDW